MEVFDELKSQWGKQSQLEVPIDGAKQVMDKIRSIKKQQRITNLILACTGLVLIFFFFYISAYQFRTVTIGLLLMISALLIRIGLEFFSIRTLKRLNITEDAIRFKQHLTKYYKNRTRVHFIFTPLIIIQYCIGFMMLLPAFKSSLTEGFYSYIVISSVLLLVVLSWFIAKQIKNELRMLKDLKA